MWFQVPTATNISSWRSFENVILKSFLENRLVKRLTWHGFFFLHPTFSLGCMHRMLHVWRNLFIWKPGLRFCEHLQECPLNTHALLGGECSNVASCVQPYNYICRAIISQLHNNATNNNFAVSSVWGVEEDLIILHLRTTWLLGKDSPLVWRTLKQTCPHRNPNFISYS
jgi:hypothetical protein